MSTKRVLFIAGRRPMSVQKFLAEADKLLEKGKIPEAVEKLKAAVESDPGNQLVVTKLANLYFSCNRPVDAAQVYVRLAERLSNSGKNQVAIAVFKKALDILPNDFVLRAKYAFECEQGGKLGDANSSGQEVLRHYLARKKYFDALNIFPLLFRVQPREPSLRASWIDTLIKGQADQKIIHFLVALCGPPGIVSAEIPTGGDPTEMSPEIYERLKQIVAWYPRDPKAAYSLAWVAYRKQKLPDFFHYLREAIRRDPDFSLAYLLFARYLSDAKRLNECIFVYKLTKERMPLDRSGDQLMLQRQLEAFTEKNGWIEFSEGTGGDDDLSAKSFLEIFSPREHASGTNESENSENESGNEKTKNSDLLNSDPNSQGAISVPAEIELHDSNEENMVLEHNRESTVLFDKSDQSLQFTGIIKAPINLPEQSTKSKIQADSGYNPLSESSESPSTAPNVEPSEREERTMQFSPMDILSASSGKRQTEYKQPTKESAKKAAAESDFPPVFIEGDRTIIFSPIETIAKEGEAKPTQEETKAETISDPPVLFSQISSLNINDDSDKTRVVQRLAPEPEKIVPKEPVEVEMATVVATAVVATEVQMKPELAQTVVGVPLPEIEEESKPDLGDDLLEGKTRVLIVDTQKEATAHLISEIARDINKNQEFDLRQEMILLLRKSERFLAKRNYYLARKALRHAQILGADPEMVKERLREVRKAELPDSMYAMVSNDSPLVENTENLLQQLEGEFNSSEDNQSSEQLLQKMDPNFELTLDRVLGESDPQTLFDLGVGLYEMGLYSAAEKIFTSLVQKDPSSSFNAYFLSAMARTARKDYAGAVSILKKLSGDKSKSEEEKLPIYYSLGEVLEKMQQHERSKAIFEKVAKIDANFRNVKEKISGQ